MDLLAYEKALGEQGYSIICGVDEAGRGPLAGPVFAAAVILPPDHNIPGVNDSKKLSEKKREELFGEICTQALSYSIASASEQEIDEINILNATYLAMKRAVQGLSIQPSLVLVDGNGNPKVGIETQTLVKGDATSLSIAAASILAKVARDRYMLELDQAYPQYALKQHKGYPTKLHYEKLHEFGISPVHRKTFLKKMH